MAREVALAPHVDLAARLIAEQQPHHDTYEAARAAALDLARRTVTALEGATDLAPTDPFDGLETGGGFHPSARSAR